MTVIMIIRSAFYTLSALKRIDLYERCIRHLEGRGVHSSPPHVMGPTPTDSNGKCGPIRGIVPPLKSSKKCSCRSKADRTACDVPNRQKYVVSVPIPDAEISAVRCLAACCG